MACHIPPLIKAKKQGEMPLPSLGPIPKSSLFFGEKFLLLVQVATANLRLVPINAHVT